MGHLTIDHATKRYGSLTAVDDVSFEAQSGRILGLLGPNGAGKTSTIRMITYITVPDSGRVLLDGKPVGPWSQAQMGYLPEERGLYKKLKVGEQLVYLGTLKGLSRSEALKKTRYWLERFDLKDWAHKKTEELSKGMQQKIGFIGTILHDPKLLILDEPFAGLDPINSELLRQIITEFKEKGCTILFASHRMEQVEQMCDDICLISKGSIVLKGALREVKRSFGRNTVILEFAGGDGFLDRLEVESGLRMLSRSAGRAEIQLVNNTPEVRKQLLDRALASVDELYRYELVEPSMNDIFVSVVSGRKLGEPIAENVQAL